MALTTLLESVIKNLFITPKNYEIDKGWENMKSFNDKAASVTME